MAQSTFTIPGRGAVSQAQWDAYWRQTAANDPELQRIGTLIRAGGKGANGQKYSIKQLGDLKDQRLAALGYEAPHDYSVAFDANTGQWGTRRQSYAERNSDWIVPLVAGAAVAGPFAASALGGSAAGAGGGAAPTAAAGGSLPPIPAIGQAAGAGGWMPGPVGVGGAGHLSTLTPSVSLGAAPAAGAAGATAAAAPTALSGLAKAGKVAAKILDDPFVKIGLGVAGDYFSNRADNKAIDKALAAQQAATDKAMKISGDVYNEQRRDFQNLANVPFQTMGDLMGMSIPNIGPSTAVPGQPGFDAQGNQLGPMTNSRMPGASQRVADYQAGHLAPRDPLPPGAPSLAELNPPRANFGGTLAQMAGQHRQQQTQSTYVRMKAPDGSVRQVPQARVREAEAQGGQVVG